MRLNDRPVRADHVLRQTPVVEASRSDLRKGCFAAFESAMEIRPCGSIAYKLARLAAGCSDAVFSLTPKNEWDIAAGVLLVEAAGGTVRTRSGARFTFNRRDTRLDGIVAATAEAYDTIRRSLAQAEAGT